MDVKIFEIFFGDLPSILFSYIVDVFGNFEYLDLDILIEGLDRVIIFVGRLLPSFMLALMMTLMNLLRLFLLSL